MEMKETWFCLLTFWSPEALNGELQYYRQIHELHKLLTVFTAQHLGASQYL